MDFGSEKLANVSDAKNMYPVFDKQQASALFKKGYDVNYPNRAEMEYKPPQVIKHFPKSHSFVHTCIDNKYKVNLEHFKGIYSKEVFTKEKADILN